MVADLGGAISVLRPIAAGHVLARREGETIFCRSRQDIMLVDDELTAGNTPAILGAPDLLADLAFGRMQLLDIGRDLHAGRVYPRTLADAISGINRRFSAYCLSAEIGVPQLFTGARLGRECLAIFVGPRDTSEIGAIGAALAGDEKGHVRELRRRPLSECIIAPGQRHDNRGEY